MFELFTSSLSLSNVSCFVKNCSKLANFFPLAFAHPVLISYAKPFSSGAMRDSSSICTSPERNASSFENEEEEEAALEEEDDIARVVIALDEVGDAATERVEKELFFLLLIMKLAVAFLFINVVVFVVVTIILVLLLLLEAVAATAALGLVVVVVVVFIIIAKFKNEDALR